MSHHDTERRAHREPLLWLVVGLPLAETWQLLRSNGIATSLEPGDE